MSCPSIFDEIAVTETMYGRKDPSVCVHPSIPSSTICQEQETQINAQIRGLCEGEHTCEVAANNDLLAKAGTTICPNVYKYLDIKFRLVCFHASLFFTLIWGNRKFLQPSLSLPKNHVIVVVQMTLVMNGLVPDVT